VETKLKLGRLKKMPSDSAVTGAIGEKLVCIELIKRKIKFWEMKERNPVFDIIVENNNCLKKVQVKSTMSKRNHNVSFHHNSSFDYLIFVRILEIGNEFFIIPIKDFGEKRSISLKNKNNCKKYKDNWKIFSICLDCGMGVGMQPLILEEKETKPTLPEKTKDALNVEEKE